MSAGSHMHRGGLKVAEHNAKAELKGRLSIVLARDCIVMYLRRLVMVVHRLDGRMVDGWMRIN